MKQNQISQKHLGIFGNIKTSLFFFFFTKMNLAQIENWLMKVITVAFQHIVLGFYMSGNEFGF